MSVSRPSLAASGLALAVALSLSPGSGLARDRWPAAKGVAEVLSPPVEEHDIIFVMPPLKPVKGAALRKPQPAVAETAPPAASAQKQPEPAPKAIIAQEAPKADIQKAEAATPAVQAPGAPKAATGAAEPQGTLAATASQGNASKPPTATANATPSPKADGVVAPEKDAAEIAAAEQKPALTAQKDEAPKAPPKPAAAASAAVAPPALTAEPPNASLASTKAPSLDAPAAGPETSGAPAAAPVPAPEPPANVAEAAPEEPTSQEAPTPRDALEADAPESAETVVEAPAPAEPALESDSASRIGALLAQGVIGPAEILLAERATLSLPADRVFVASDAARKLAAEVGLDLRPGVQGIVTPADGRLEWLAPVELLDDGHIGLGEPGSLDAAKLLAAFEASLPQINARRAANGKATVTLKGWLTPPALDDDQLHLSACVNVAGQDGPKGAFFNCEAWALGRDGAVRVGLAEESAQAARLKGEAAALARAIVFGPGRTYAEFDAASDKAAPYAISDLLIRDVSLRGDAAPAAAPPPEGAPESESGESIFDMLTDPLYLAIFSGVMILLYLRAKRVGDEKPATEKPAQDAENSAPTQEQSPVAPAVAAPSLFARLLPTLHARFARKGAPAPAPDAQAAPPAPAAAPGPSLFARLLPTLHRRFARKAAAPAGSQPLESAPAPEGLTAAHGGLTETIAAARAAAARSQSSAPAQAAARVGSPAKADPPAKGGASPLSVLKKLAQRMRAGEEPPPPVSTARIMRPARGAAGAALAAVEAVVQPMTAPEAEPTTALLAQSRAVMESVAEAEATLAAASAAPATPAAPAATLDLDDLGLVEPGDPAATSAAINAARARQEASGE